MSTTTEQAVSDAAATNAVASASADALLTEHFRYTPLSLIDDIINSVNAIVYRALSAVETGLLNTAPAALGFSASSSSSASTHEDDSAELARVEVETGVHQLETLLEAAVDRDFDKFEIYTLRNILCVPTGLDSWVRLPHYEGIVETTAGDASGREGDSSGAMEGLTVGREGQRRLERIEQLREEIQAARRLQIGLERAHARTEHTLERLRELVKPPSAPPSAAAASTNAGAAGPMAFLVDPMSTKGERGGLSARARFAASQLPTLRSLVAELQPSIDELERTAATTTTTAAAAADPEGGQTDAEKRRAYVEGATRRAVQRRLGAEGLHDSAATEQAAADREAGKRGKWSEEEVSALEGLLASGKVGSDTTGKG